ncbi:MAG: fibrobacter succinogenes major paralogous domain-containing protein, partial [Bacteroidales bacterium]|nr:fibrobacter succinogenes major paralogous domain-containing protein [Bacteroidales bacterium]
CWMKENLAYLPDVSPPSNGSQTSSYHYVYGYDGSSVSEAKATSNYQTYGVLYNWPAASTACPDGWHLPSDDEWTILTDYLGGESVAGGKMKETGTTHWNSPNTGATNESGFSCLPGGYYYGGSYYYLGSSGYWWSSAEYSSTYAWYRRMGYDYGNVARSSSSKALGFSVRCLRD